MSMGQFMPIGARGVDKFEVGFLASVGDIVDRSTYTFNDLPFGMTGQNRKIIIVVQANFSSGRTINSVTIGGVPATIHYNPDPTGGVGAAWVSAVVPSGTAGSVVVNFNATNLRCVVSLFRMLNAKNSEPHGTGFTNGLSGSFNIDVPRDGVVFAAQTASEGVSGSIEGVNEYYRNNYEFPNWIVRGGMVDNLSEQVRTIKMAAPSPSNIATGISWR